MTKAEFIAYLHGVKLGCTAVDEAQIWDEILATAARIEPETITVPSNPTYPSNPWWDPYKPYVTWTTDKIELDNQSDFEYNGIKIKKDGTLPNPNDWSIETNTPGPPDFKVVK